MVSRNSGNNRCHTGRLASWRSFLVRRFRALLGRQPSSNLSPLDSNNIQNSPPTSNLSPLDSNNIQTSPPTANLSPLDSNNIQTSLSSRRICKYDVFISFRGTDTRNTFTDHLYAHLIRKGIFAYKDDKMLEKGEPISPQLLQAIKDSRVSIIIFSKDYAASTWCLDEMATIADCQKQLKQTVFPVFYDVDPSQVRNQNGVYENAFVLHTKKFKEVPGKVDRWKRAMTSLANSVGWDVGNKQEFAEIKMIVQEVIKTLNHKFSGFAEDLIGIQPHVERLEKLLRLSSENDDFRVLGIWGMGGIGKTTHANVLYDKISYQFDACCFIENISKIYKDGGAIAVQKQILHQTLKEKNLETYSPSEISGIVRNRLSRIKVLIVLDNVDELDQLEKLAISPKLLGTGSRIIITTRNEFILKGYEADEIYQVPLLNNDDACELFGRKAFKSNDPSSSCVDLTPEVLKYAQGLPLAIRVVGSFFYTRDATQWRDALDRLGNNPDNKIMDLLHISFEGLQPEEKEIFLHIACFFKGKREDYVKRILDSCGLHPHIGIPVIIEKSLITIKNQEIHMHEMLQELGKKIVRQQFPQEPGSWSRLWLYQDFHHVLTTETGTNKVKAIVLDQNENVSECPQLKAEGLSIMRDLRILILYHNNFSGSFNFLANSLQYLLWHGYPFDSLPLNFEAYSLVELNMRNSTIQRLWKGRKRLPHLKRLDLSNSKYLIETPNFEWTPRLERLDLTGCTNLLQVHPSIGLLEKLAFLSLEGCSNLVNLDFGSVKLSSVIVLHLSGCTKLENTPDFTGLSNLEYLDIDQCTSLSTVDESIGALTVLKFLSLRDCTNLVSIPNSINAMSSLINLDLCGCLKLMNLSLEHGSKRVLFSSELDTSESENIELSRRHNLEKFQMTSCLKSLIFLDVGFCNLREVPDAIGKLRCLERLNLEGNNFVSLPYSIRRLYHLLAYLNLSHCSKLRSLPEPSFPFYRSSSGGMYFKTVSGSRNHRSGLYIFNCPVLEFPEEGQNMALLWLTRLVEHPCLFRCGFDIVIPGNKIPGWFDHQFMGGSIIRIMDFDVDDNWIGFSFCVTFEVNYCPTISGSSHNSFSSLLPHPLYLSFESEHAEESFDMPLGLELDKVDGSEHLWLIYISRPHCHFVKNGPRITFKALSCLKMRQWGLRMVFKQDIEKKRELQFACLGGGKANQAAHLHFDYVHHESSSNSGFKIQLPYNWFITKEEENENIEAKAKESNLSNMGLFRDQRTYSPL